MLGLLVGNTYYIYSTMLTIMDLVVSNYGTAVCSNLYSC